MSDLRVLQDAFTELERRADSPQARPAANKSRLPRLVPVAATALVAAVLAVGVTVLAPGDESAPVPAGTKPSPTTSLPVHGSVPATPQELAQRFKVVLGDAGAITVTDPEYLEPNGVAIAGVLTFGELRGGYHLQYLKTRPGTKAWCDAADKHYCEVRTLPDGTSGAVGTADLAGPDNALTYLVNVIHPDGTELILRVSNEEDPRGGSRVLAPQPPLDRGQMVEAVMSKHW